MMLLSEVYERLEKEVWEVIHCDNLTPAYAQALHCMVQTMKDIKKMEYFDKVGNWMEDKEAMVVPTNTKTVSPEHR